MMRISRALLSIVLAGVVTFGSGCMRNSGPSREDTAADLMERIERLAARGDSIAIGRSVHAACSNEGTRTACIENQLVPVASRGEVKIAMGALSALAGLDGGIRADGHVFAHAIGIAAGKTTEDVASAFSQCSEAFQSGCYHGVIQAWFAKQESVGPAEANALCEPFRGDESNRWIRFQCVHGMGHGLTMLYGHDLLEGLRGCDLLSDSWDRHSCYGGAFMENIVNVTNPHHPASALAQPEGGEHGNHAPADHAGHHPVGSGAARVPFKAVDPGDQQYPCSIVEERYLSSCYGMQTSVMLFNNSGDIRGAAMACEQAPRDMREICFTSLGRDISSYSQQKHDEAVAMCSLASPTYQPQCIVGVVKNFIDINAKPSEGIAFCRTVTGHPNKRACYRAVGEQIVVLSPIDEKRREMCRGSEVAFIGDCLRGARVVVDN